MLIWHVLENSTARSIDRACDRRGHAIQQLCPIVACQGLLRQLGDCRVLHSADSQARFQLDAIGDVLDDRQRAHDPIGIQERHNPHRLLHVRRAAPLHAGRHRKQVAVQALRQDGRIARQHLPVAVVEEARGHFRKYVEQFLADDFAGRPAAVRLKPVVDAGHRQVGVGRQNSPIRGLLKRFQHGRVKLHVRSRNLGAARKAPSPPRPTFRQPASIHRKT